MKNLNIKVASRRRMFQSGRPNRAAALVNRATVALAAAGLSPKRLVALDVRGRHSGRRISLPVVVADYDGERYLVSMLGQEANWVRNVRAAGGHAQLRHRRREIVRLEPVTGPDRPAILQRYLQLAPGARAHIPVDRDAPVTEFVPIAADYPIFRIVTPPPDR